ncbi:hypothetical protein HYE67_005787 [Fusarium culmorum]|uniref:Uncharacterized protein n=1 Tax=Fusarium culmorum TaxID=5516 RepID=A0A2T4GEB6_FUSCU|nr:hypothetical protein FCULG_00010443 [Fusarium culmorum]QPC63556.1 hypothetical protein HYE67_005787 [Fusarium culmorum]
MAPPRPNPRDPFDNDHDKSQSTFDWGDDDDHRERSNVDINNKMSHKLNHLDTLTGSHYTPIDSFVNATHRLHITKTNRKHPSNHKLWKDAVSTDKLDYNWGIWLVLRAIYFDTVDSQDKRQSFRNGVAATKIAERYQGTDIFNDTSPTTWAPRPEKWPGVTGHGTATPEPQQPQAPIPQSSRITTPQSSHVATPQSSSRTTFHDRPLNRFTPINRQTRITNTTQQTQSGGSPAETDPFAPDQADQPVGTSPTANLSTSRPMGDGSTNVDNRQRHFDQPAANSFIRSGSTIGNAQPYPGGVPPLHAHNQGVYQVPSIGAQQFSVSHPCPPSRFEHYESEQRLPAAVTHDHHDRAILPHPITSSYRAPGETYRDSLQSGPSSFSSRRYDPSHSQRAQSSIGDKTQNEPPSSHGLFTKLGQTSRIPHGAPGHIPSAVTPQGSSSQTGTLTGSEAIDNKAICGMIMNLIEPQIVSRIEGTITEVKKEVSDHFEFVVSGQARHFLNVHIPAIARQTAPLIERLKDEMKPWIAKEIESGVQSGLQSGFETFNKDIIERINRDIDGMIERSMSEWIKRDIDERFQQHTGEIIAKNVAERVKRDITRKIEQDAAIAINIAKLKLIESNKTDLTTRFNNFKGALSP